MQPGVTIAVSEWWLYLLLGAWVGHMVLMHYNNKVLKELNDLYEEDRNAVHEIAKQWRLVTSIKELHLVAFARDRVWKDETQPQENGNGYTGTTTDVGASDPAGQTGTGKHD